MLDSHKRLLALGALSILGVSNGLAIDFLVTKEEKAGLFRNRQSVVEKRLVISPKPQAVTSIHSLRTTAENISRLRLPYVFGGSSPRDGGMDCSGSVMHLLTASGYRNVPRTSFAQYDWIRENSRIKRSRNIDPKHLRPGDLIFWGGTYRSGHKVSHVMFYMGQSTNGKLYMFGARGQKLTGISGAGVDIYELRPGQHKNLIGFGPLPKL